MYRKDSLGPNFSLLSTYLPLFNIVAIIAKGIYHLEHNIKEMAENLQHSTLCTL